MGIGVPVSKLVVFTTLMSSASVDIRSVFFDLKHHDSERRSLYSGQNILLQRAGHFEQAHECSDHWSLSSNT
jgi:hypothetical protein